MSAAIINNENLIIPLNYDKVTNNFFSLLQTDEKSLAADVIFSSHD